MWIGGQRTGLVLLQQGPWCTRNLMEYHGSSSHSDLVTLVPYRPGRVGKELQLLPFLNHPWHQHFDVFKICRPAELPQGLISPHDVKLWARPQSMQRVFNSRTAPVTDWISSYSSSYKLLLCGQGITASSPYKILNLLSHTHGPNSLPQLLISEWRGLECSWLFRFFFEEPIARFAAIVFQFLLL